METGGRKTLADIDFFEDLTGDLACPAPAGAESIGRRIRAVREEQGISREELARLTGFDLDYLAGVEAGEIQPPLGELMRLSRALRSAFGAIVSGAGEKPYAVTRVHERRVVQRSSAHGGKRHLYSYRSLAPEVRGRHMEAFLVQLGPAAEKDLSLHEGEEFVFVLEGTVRLEIGGETFDLEPGDSAYYLSSTPHQISAAGERATILAVLYPA